MTGLTRRILVVLIAVAGIGASATAQVATGSVTRELVTAGSEWERYLRALQLEGLVPLYPWSARAFGPREVARLMPADTGHPWASRVHREAPSLATARFLDPVVALRYNSTFPYGEHDGPVWAGRGLTSELQLGAMLRFGPLSLDLAPEFFRAENAAFPLMPNGQQGPLRFADGQRWFAIDLPQRFGAGPYQRFDPGQSTLRLDLFGVAAGISTANEFWGPAVQSPILLGDNAAGFPHLFLGTSRALDIGIGRLAGRIIWGQLDQSDFAQVVPGRDTRRYSAGLVATLAPRGVPGLELGLGRFFHSEWPQGGLADIDFAEPLQGFFKAAKPDNQLASGFARWVFPRSHFEIYGEIGKEDHNADWRDLVQEPDHDLSYMVGVQKLWTRGPSRFVTLRGELLNARVTELQLGRPQTPFYVHTPEYQGHTYLGQLLGAPGGLGGGASLLAFDSYDERGRWTVSWARTMRGERLGTTGLPDAAAADVMHALGVETVRFGRRADLTAGLTAVYDFNRNFTADVFNLNATLGMRAHW